MIAVVPSESRSLVADDVSPPASGAVATTAAAEELLGVPGHDGLAGHERLGCRLGLAEVGQLLQGGDEDGAGPLHHRQHLLEALLTTVVRVRHLATRFDRVEVAEQPDPVRVRRLTRRRFDAAHVGEVAGVHRQDEVVGRRASRRRTAGPGAADGS